MKYIPLFLTISLGIAHGKSNSSGPDSPVLYGEIIGLSDDRKTVTILQSGTDKREITITKKTKLSFVGMGKKSQELKVGYWGKAKVKNREAGSLKLTQPVGKLNPLGPERISMDEKSIFTAVDVNRDSGIDYVEMSRSIYHSPKHGPDKFEKFDNSRGSSFYWLTAKHEDSDRTNESDRIAVKNGFISITPIHSVQTDFDFMSELNTWKIA